MYSKAACLTCARLFHACRWMSSFLNVAFHDSAAALSKQMPVCPTDGMIPLERQASRNALPVYWLPRSELSRIRLNSDYAEVDVKPENLRMAC